MSKKWDVTFGEVLDVQHKLRTNHHTLRSLFISMQNEEGAGASEEQIQKHKQFLTAFRSYVDVLEESIETLNLYPVIQHSSAIGAAWDDYHTYLKTNLVASKKYMAHTWRAFTSNRTLVNEIQDAASLLYGKAGTDGLESLASLSTKSGSIADLVDMLYYLGEHYPAPDMAYLPPTRELAAYEILNDPTLFTLNLILAKQNKIELMLEVIFDERPDYRKRYRIKKDEVGRRAAARVRREERMNRQTQKTT